LFKTQEEVMQTFQFVNLVLLGSEVDSIDIDVRSSIGNIFYSNHKKMGFNKVRLSWITVMLFNDKRK
jgi:hypothetical protein